MLTMIEDYFGPENVAYVIWAGLAFAAILVALLVYLVLRRTFSGTYVAGGRNRRPRLAILDAAAVDARRRLVLVRRDETEHLILIGGPTDVVVESGIRPGGMPAPRPAGVAPQQQPQRRPSPQPAPAPAAAPPRPPAHQPAEIRVAAPAPRPAVEPPPARTAPAERTVMATAVEPPPAAEPASPFRRFFSPKPAAPVGTPMVQTEKSDVDRSLEEEMSRLLDEMTEPKK